MQTAEKSVVAPFLDQDIICDWLVIGSGFAGISAAKRLTELRSGDKIILIDAIGIGEGAAGQNSGFMIDVPHNINAKGDYLSSIKKDKIIFIGKHEILDKYYNLASKYSRIDFIEDDAHSILNFEEKFFSVIHANNIRD